MVAFGQADDRAVDSRDASDRSPYLNAFEQLGALIDEVVAADHVVGLAMARRCEAIEAARQHRVAMEALAPGGSTKSGVELAVRAFRAEIAAALRLPERTAETLIWTSRTLVNTLPATLTALKEGRVAFRHAQILVDHSYALDPDAVVALEEKMLPMAERTTASQFEARVRKARERLNPDSMAERQVKAVAERSICSYPEEDGMVTIAATLPAGQGVAIMNRLDAIARSLQGEAETRTLTQLRLDVFSDLLLDTGGHSPTVGVGANPVARYRNIRPTVLVTIPAMTMLRHSIEPGTLEGYGPIDPQTAREIASFSKTMQRLLTDPHTGVILGFGRKRYRIPKDLRTWLRVRDGTCRFPGCNTTAARCDVDHTHEWAEGGHTTENNLAHLCRTHHTLKTAGHWKVQQTGAGVLAWTSPAGHEYTTAPETRVDALG